jgi:hypothetical protein
VEDWPPSSPSPCWEPGTWQRREGDCFSGDTTRSRTAAGLSPARDDINGGGAEHRTAGTVRDRRGELDAELGRPAAHVGGEAVQHEPRQAQAVAPRDDGAFLPALPDLHAERGRAALGQRRKKMGWAMGSSERQCAPTRGREKNQTLTGAWLLLGSSRNA